MSRRICVFLRHGDYRQLPDVPSAHQPFPLTERGSGQAVLGAQKLELIAQELNWTFDPVVHCSNQLRAYQTAEILVANLKPLQATDRFNDLAERGLGSAANLTVEQIEEVLRADPRYDAPPENWKSDSRYRLPLQGAESLMDAGRRVAKHLKTTMEALEVPDGVTVAKVFVGHGASFRHAAYQLGILKMEQIARLSMHHADPIAFEVSKDGHWLRVAGAWKERSTFDLQLD